MTLKFLGEVNDHELQQIINQLKLIDHQAFELTLSSIGLFTTHGQKIIWCGLNESAKLIDLQSDIDACLGNYFKPNNQFIPHITLARINKKMMQKGADELLEKLIKKVAASALLKVSRFHLMASDIKGSEPRYKCIKSFALK